MDASLFVDALRHPHSANEDAEKTWRGLREVDIRAAMPGRGR